MSGLLHYRAYAVFDDECDVNDVIFGAHVIMVMKREFLPTKDNLSNF